MPPDTERSASSMLPATGLAAFPGPAGPPHRCNVVNREDAAARAEFDRVLAEIARRLPDLIDGQCDEVVICIDAIEEPVSDDVRRGPCDDDFRLLANVVANIRPGIRRDARKSSGGIDFEKPVAIEIEVISL